MKANGLLSIMVLLICSAVSYAQSVNESVRFDDKIHDFGTISESAGKVTHRFRFTNVGSEPVVMLRARAGCNCVQAQVPSAPIAPGASDYVTVTFDPEYRPGHFSKEIVVYSGDRQYNRIWVKGDVEEGAHNLAENYRYDLGSGLRTNYRVMNFGHVVPGSRQSKTLTLANNSSSTMRINFRSDDPDVEVSGGCLLRPGGEAKIEIIVSPRSKGSMQRSVMVYPTVADKQLQPVEIVYTPRSASK